MLDSTEAPYKQLLDDGLVLRTPAGGRDVERVAEFNGLIHGPGVIVLTRNLLLYHPATRARDLVFVEEEATGQVVSSLCLIPWTWCCSHRGGEGNGRVEVNLPVGEMGIVGTREAYRRRGLIRAQVDYFKNRLRERGCLLSSIQGIPYYYRQFGYEYALPLEGGLRLEMRDVPDLSRVSSASFAFRLARPENLPVLRQLYDEAVGELAIHTTRDEATWRYLLQHAGGTEMECEDWLVQDAGGQVVGYFRLPKHHFGKELVVNETSRLGFGAALAALHHLKTLAEARGRPAIRLNLPANCTLMRLARSLGAHDLGTYAWQIHVPDVATLLGALGPVLEGRLAGSPFAGLTREVRLAFYRETVALRFVEGRLVEVVKCGFTEGEAIRFPPLPFVQLALGYRTAEELRAVYPDVSIAPVWRLLVDTLFPKVASFIYTIY